MIPEFKLFRTHPRTILYHSLAAMNLPGILEALDVMVSSDLTMNLINDPKRI